MHATAECILCLLTKDLAALPPEIAPAERTAYLRQTMRLLADAPAELTTPQLSKQIDRAYTQCFGERKERNYAELKRYYNDRMLALEPALQLRVEQSEDPLSMAMRLACAGNYIDFGTMDAVDDTLLDDLLRDADQQPAKPAEFSRFREELSQAANVLYITDNCGEIVLDKLMLRQMRQYAPNASFAVLCRGLPALNDATVEDARAVGMDAIAPVFGNGTDYPGTVLTAISEEARSLLQKADLILSKGQANFETLNGCGLNIYYTFLCKCDLFMRRFDAERFAGMFVNERRCPPLRA